MIQRNINVSDPQVEPIDDEEAEFEKRITEKRLRVMKHLEDQAQLEEMNRRYKAVAYDFLTGRFKNKRAQSVYNKYLGGFPVYKGYK